MRAKTATMVTLALWVTFAFVTWNVVFDRHVYLAAVRFTQEQIERYQRGDQVSSIEEAYTSELSRAALRATGWGAAVLAVGVALTALAARHSRNS